MDKEVYVISVFINVASREDCGIDLTYGIPDTMASARIA
jgi:hypothetical protein